MDYPDEFANGHHVMLDTEELVTDQWEQLDVTSDVTVHQLQCLTVFVKQVQCICLGHIHQAGDLLLGGALDALDQFWQVN